MSYAQRHTVVLTTDESGDATGYTEAVTGLLSQIRYVKGNFDDNSTFAITNETTGETLWGQANVNSSATVAPRQATHDTAGAAAVYADGESAVLDKIALANDRIKVVVSAGGDTKNGTFIFLLC